MCQRFLSALANRTQRPFFSVDFSEEGYLNAREACGSCAHQVRESVVLRSCAGVVVWGVWVSGASDRTLGCQGLGEKWLEDAGGFAAAAASAGMDLGLIAVAYLDNYDWTYPWCV